MGWHVGKWRDPLARLSHALEEAILTCTSSQASVRPLPDSSSETQYSTLHIVTQTHSREDAVAPASPPAAPGSAPLRHSPTCRRAADPPSSSLAIVLNTTSLLCLVE